jgi:DNA-binding transcriptional regulator GbsR (MarR family)
MNSESSTLDGSKAKLSAFQRECIDLFVHAAQALSIPRSIGEIYGLLFSTEEPLCMEDVISRLDMSKGSASQGLRWLRDVGAARTVYVQGDRRDHFVAETELRKLASGFLREHVEPHLASGKDRLARLANATATNGNGAFASGRVRKLKRWHFFGSKLLPVLRTLAAKTEGAGE